MQDYRPTLGHILEALTDHRPPEEGQAVSTFVVDSREAIPGSFFIAFRGESVDGHDYVADAFSRGAIAALVQRPVGEWPVIDTRASATGISIPVPVLILVDDTMSALQQIARAWRARFDTRVIAITGSVGKTSTKELTAAVLSQRYRTLKSEGNQNNEIGVPLTLMNLRASHERAVIEMGMYALGEIDLLCDIARPSVGVVTMIGPVHLERLGSMEAIVAAKRELVAALPDDGVAILNMDDPRVMGMAGYTRARIFTYGLDPGADLGLRQAPLAPAARTRRDVAALGFGYGLATTQATLASAYTVFANSGARVMPTMLASGSGANVERTQIFTPAVTRQVLTYLRAAVTDGTGRAANVPGLLVAGKTGTAEKPGGAQGYDQSRNFSSFAGVFPANDPRYVIVVALDDTGAGEAGGLVAAPVVARTLRRIAPMLGLRVEP
ncbi:MAG TPA: Mur ligase family protein, partial [Promineifilum sp.]|nr:Mur ligase family protein [Promineifilum sp.]